MSHYTKNIYLKTSPAELFQAITTTEGCKAWWTPESKVGSEVGSDASFRFGRTHWTFEIKKLDPGKEVEWFCKEQFMYAPDTLSKTDEWVGTTVKYVISETEDGSELHFEHVGLNEQMECWGMCQPGWDHFLGNSLKSYLELGQGMPWSEADARKD